MAQAPFPIPNLLLLAVLFRSGGMLLAIPFPVIGIARSPFARAVPANLTVFGIGGDLRLVIISAAPSLAIRLTAHLLARLELRGLEALLAIAATPFIHTAVVLPLPPRTRSRDLETAVECLPRPRQWVFFQLQNRGNCGCFKPGITTS